MSIEALRYVKNLRESPTGEAVTLREKGILWYLADCHREEERAAWPSVRLIAEVNNIEERTVRDILKECIRKRILWRDDRFRDNGSRTSNWWRFTVVDGDPPARVLIAEEQRQILGERAAGKANASKRARKYPQESCGTRCEIPQGADAENRTPGCENGQEGDAGIRTVGCGNSQGAGAEIGRGMVRESAAPEDSSDLAVDLAVNPHRPVRENSSDDAGAAAVENADSGRRAQADKTFWRRVLDGLIWDVGESVYIRLCIKTRLLKAEMIGQALSLDVGVPDDSYEALFVKHQAAVNRVVREMGFSVDDLTIRFRPIEWPTEVV